MTIMYTSQKKLSDWGESVCSCVHIHVCGWVEEEVHLSARKVIWMAIHFSNWNIQKKAQEITEC